MKLYIKGLVSRDIARTVLRASPISLQEAMNNAIDGDEVEDALHRLGHREEEPMDVSSIVQKQTNSSSIVLLLFTTHKLNYVKYTRIKTLKTHLRIKYTNKV